MTWEFEIWICVGMYVNNKMVMTAQHLHIWIKHVVNTESTAPRSAVVLQPVRQELQGLSSKDMMETGLCKDGDKSV